MNNIDPPSEENSHEMSTASKKSLRLLVNLVGIEAVLVSAGAIYFLTLTFTEVSGNPAGAIVIFLITALVAVGLWISTFALLKGKGWSRGLVVTWQFIQFALATSFAQGLAEWQIFGWFLLVLSLGTFVLALSKKISESLEPRS
jgi:hypothetical protein